MRWNGQGVAAGTALTTGNVNAAGNGDTVTRSVSGTPASWTFQGRGMKVVAGSGIIARLDAALTAGRGVVAQTFITPDATTTADDIPIQIRTSSAEAASARWTTTGTIRLYLGATASNQSPAITNGHRIRIDLLVQQDPGTRTTTNGRAIMRVQDLDDASWNGGVPYFTDVTGVNVQTADLTAARFGKLAGNYPVGQGVLFEELGWDAVALPAGTTNQGVIESTYLMASPFSSPSYSASPTLSGGGLLTAVALPGQVAAPSLSGSGALSATATPGPKPTVALTGSGSLSIIAGPGAPVALSGSGSLSAIAAPSIPRAAALSGSGTLSAAQSGAAASGSASLSGSGELEAGATTPVQTWMANTPMWVAHRGGSLNWPEHTMFAYDQAVAWRDDLALEASMFKSADGVWVLNHDNQVSAGSSWANPGVGNITARNWVGDLENIVSVVGGYPMIRLVDLLAKYGNSRILVLDNKNSTDMTGWLNLLDSYAGNARYIIKGFFQDNAKATAARARGYQTWGYYYGTDASQIASTNGPWTILGMNNSASAGEWALANAPGKPVWAHIIQNMTAYNQVQPYNPAGYMVSGVQQVVPQTPEPVMLSGSGTLGALGSPGIPRAASLSGAGTLTATGRPSAAASASLSGLGTLGAVGTPAPGSVASLGGTGSLTVSAKPGKTGEASFTGAGTLLAFAGSSGGSAPNLSGGGALTLAGTPSFARTAALSGGGALTATGSQSQVGTASLSGLGTLAAVAELPPSDFCWPNPINLVPLGPASTLIPMGPMYGLVPLGPILGLAVEDPC